MNDVKAFWDGRAADPSLDAAQVTHNDIWQRWLEIEYLKKVLPRGLRVIDIGCGAGYATKQLAPLAGSILGADFSPGMIERALGSGEPPPANASFEVADVLSLEFEEPFDVAFTIRCLINLPDWEAQKRALANIAHIVKPGGLYIFIEGFVEGRANLNTLRQGVGLEPMPVVWHNCDFERERTLDFLANYFSLEQEIGFGSYDLVARVVHPLLVAPDQPKYTAKINEVAARVALQRPGDTEHSRVAFYCLRRHSTSGLSG
jgi:SAM-dependent methyltransferase